jgi:hypothetical protein
MKIWLFGPMRGDFWNTMCAKLKYYHYYLFGI